MRPNDRRYGSGKSIPFPVWNGILEHRRRIGGAIWEFLWCVDKITKEIDGIGWVLGKSPVKAKCIAGDLKLNEKTVRTHLSHLRQLGYITVDRTPYGFVIGVTNSRKFEIWHSKENGKKARSRPRETTQNHPISPAKMPDLTGENARSKEDAAFDAVIDAAGRSVVWAFLGVDGSGWPPPIRDVCANLYQAKDGQTPVGLAGVCMDTIEALGERIPAALAQRAAELRSHSRANAGCLSELEALPWVKK